MVFLSPFPLSPHVTAHLSLSSTYVTHFNLNLERMPELALPQPGRYAEMLAERMAKHNVDCWLINTGWTGGRFGSGKRCPLKFTRRIVDAVHSGELAKAEFEHFGTFNLSIPTSLDGVPRELLNPSLAWADKEAFQKELRKLAGMFKKAFHLYEKDVDDKVRLAGPTI
jgi:phosphoenolpyruvate carboxykinase (ATP)